MAAFRDLVYALVLMVPAGRVTSYGRLAALLGYPGKAREVGWALHTLPCGLNVPAHRVVRQDGAMAGGTAFGTPEVQRALLGAEGVRFNADGRVNLVRHLWPSAQAIAAAKVVLNQAVDDDFDGAAFDDYNAPLRDT